MMVGLPPSPRALDFDIAIMLRGLYEERVAREEYERKRSHGDAESVDAEHVTESVLL